MELTLETAKKISSTAQEKAKEMNIPMVIALVDKGGNLILEERMDGAMIAGIRIAHDKAYTAAATTFPTHELGKLSQPGQEVYGLANTDNGRMIIFGGGLPLKDKEGTMAGGIGVSGGIASQDQQVAQAGLDAFMELA
jgi:uncharacterized protein GlcG (DUF336 family)